MTDLTLADAAQALLDDEALAEGPLWTDIESEIHMFMGHDGQSDETNDWVNDLMSAVWPHIERALAAPTRVQMAWWHTEKNADGTQHCNHLAHAKYECGRETGQWSPLYMEADMPDPRPETMADAVDNSPETMRARRGVQACDCPTLRNDGAGWYCDTHGYQPEPETMADQTAGSVTLYLAPEQVAIGQHRYWTRWTNNGYVTTIGHPTIGDATAYITHIAGQTGGTT